MTPSKAIPDRERPRERTRFPVEPLLEEAVKTPVLENNCVETLVNGDQIFPAMLQDIGHAKREICFETFIYWSGDIAHRFAGALSAAARRGVEVRVLLDGWGAKKMSQELVDEMRGAGAQVKYFNPIRWWNLDRMNHRTHRKIMVVDRLFAYTGGVGIADVWQGDARSPEEWHDLHYRLTGPVARQIHDAFRHVWTEVLGENSLPPMEKDPTAEEASRRQPDSDAERPVDSAGYAPAQAYWSSPRRDSECVYEAFSLAIRHARKSVRLTTPYFVPDQDAIGIFIDAVKRGVTVDVIVPGKHIDKDVVRYASRASWGDLIEAGVRIHVYEPTMVHAKALVVDGQWVIIGSANFDNRSFSLNDEINVNVFSPAFAARHDQIFENDLQRCHPITYQAWKRRGLGARLRELVCNPFRSQV